MELDVSFQRLLCEVKYDIFIAAPLDTLSVLYSSTHRFQLVNNVFKMLCSVVKITDYLLRDLLQEKHMDWVFHI